MMILKRLDRHSLWLAVLLVLLTGCFQPGATPSPTQIETPAAPSPTQRLETEVSEMPTETSSPPMVVEYNLGETTIIQANFPQESRFREMPVRLNGIIAAPPGEGGPRPVVVILHGNHPGCPIAEGDIDVDRWPCAPELERPNYRGFGYLVRELAEDGYVALSININAENTFGYGEPVPGERLEQLIDLHLKALGDAASGGSNPFGLELEGRVDLHKLALFGHSRGGEAAFWLAHSADLASPEAFAERGYGPVAGLLLVAPAVGMAELSGSRVPLGILLPACDMDMMFQEGQHFYEEARLSPEQELPAVSIWLERANHNSFNETLQDEAGARPGRPDCTTLLEPERQRDFLTDYARDFLTSIFSQDLETILEAKTHFGADMNALAPGELYGLPARVAALAARTERQPLLVPKDKGELKTHLMGGDVSAEEVTLFYCEAGYYTPTMKPGSEPCKRVNLTVPGDPAMLVVSWSKPGAALRFELPEGSGDLDRYLAFSLRAAQDPLSPLNTKGAYQGFSVQLTDRDGNSAALRTRPAEPALIFPAGLAGENESFEGGLFSGRVPMTTIRLLLSDFKGVNLAEIREIALVFDQAPSGSLFLGDIEFLQEP